MKIGRSLTLLVVAIGGMALSRDVSSGDDRLVRTGDTGPIHGSADACDAATVERRLTELFAAMSNGESEIAERFFAYGKEAPFQWYSFTERHLGIQEHYVTYSRDSLVERFAGRRDSGDRMVFRSVAVNRSGMGALHFGPVEFDFFDGSNPAAEQGGYSGTGKGAYHCGTESFIVLSLGTRSPGVDPGPDRVPSRDPNSASPNYTRAQAQDTAMMESPRKNGRDHVIRNAIASLAVSNISNAARWYERLFGRSADTAPMQELLEWKFQGGGWLQVYQAPDRAGKGSCTLSVSDLAGEVARLRHTGFDTGEPTETGAVKVMMIKDPDGNSIAFAETSDSR